MIKATIKGNIPSKSNCYKIITLKSKTGKTHSSLAKTKAMTNYEKDFFIQMPPKFRNINFDQYFNLHVDVFYPSQRSDLDNSLKILLDCLQKVTKSIKNDNKCIRIVANKALDKDNPRIEFEILPA